MQHPVFVIPEAMKAMQALAGASRHQGLPDSTIKLVQLRASQINGCGVCVDMHAVEMKDAGESFERILGIGAWHDSPYFTDAERAALALTEAATRLSDKTDPIPDDLWAEAARHYDQSALAALCLAIANINVWNRLNALTRQVAGEWRKAPVPAAARA
jgi:AhpD family alkylhydroperoxidase